MNPVVRLTCGGFAALTVTTPHARLLAGIDLRALLPPIIIARGERQREGKRFASSKAGNISRITNTLGKNADVTKTRDNVPARRPDARTARNPVVAANERKGFWRDGKHDDDDRLVLMRWWWWWYFRESKM